MKVIALLVSLLLGACTINILAGNCTRAVTQMGDARQIQEQCR